MQAVGIRRAADEQKDERLAGCSSDIAKLRRTSPGVADRAESELQQALLDWNAVTEGIAVVISAEISESRVKDEIKDKATRLADGQGEQARRRPSSGPAGPARPLPVSPRVSAGEIGRGDRKRRAVPQAGPEREGDRPDRRDARPRRLAKADDAVHRDPRRSTSLTPSLDNPDLAVDRVHGPPGPAAMRPSRAMRELVGKLRGSRGPAGAVDAAGRLGVWLVHRSSHPLSDKQVQAALRGSISKPSTSRSGSGKGGAKESDSGSTRCGRRCRTSLVDDWDRISPTTSPGGDSDDRPSSVLPPLSAAACCSGSS